MIRVHCQPDVDNFFSNGFYQTTGYVDDEEMLIAALLPNQGIQPHAHDLTEDITLGLVCQYTRTGHASITRVPCPVSMFTRILDIFVQVWRVGLLHLAGWSW